MFPPWLAVAGSPTLLTLLLLLAALSFPNMISVLPSQFPYGWLKMMLRLLNKVQFCQTRHLTLLSCMHIYSFRCLCLRGSGLCVPLHIFTHVCLPTSVLKAGCVCSSLPTVPGFRLYVATMPSAEARTACSALLRAAGHREAHLSFPLTFLCNLKHSHSFSSYGFY